MYFLYTHKVRIPVVCLQGTHPHHHTGEITFLSLRVLKIAIYSVVG